MRLSTQNPGGPDKESLKEGNALKALLTQLVG